MRYLELPYTMNQWIRLEHFFRAIEKLGLIENQTFWNLVLSSQVSNDSWEWEAPFSDDK